jgi:hypothetical protein
LLLLVFSLFLSPSDEGEGQQHAIDATSSTAPLSQDPTSADVGGKGDEEALEEQAQPVVQGATASKQSNSLSTKLPPSLLLHSTWALNLSQ